MIIFALFLFFVDVAGGDDDDDENVLCLLLFQEHLRCHALPFCLPQPPVRVKVSD